MQKWRWRLAQYLEIRWWRQYLASRPKESYLQSKQAYWSRVLKELHFEPEAGQRALEVGCGPAGLFVLLHEYQQFTAIDPLLNQYTDQLPHFKKTDYPTVNFLAQPLEEVKPPREKYPIIYCFNAINHVADWQACLEQISTMAAPAAQLLISSDVHHRKWLRNLFRFLPGDALHPQQHLAEEYVNALEQLGWEIKREQTLKPGRIFNYVAWVAVLNHDSHDS